MSKKKVELHRVPNCSAYKYTANILPFALWEKETRESNPKLAAHIDRCDGCKREVRQQRAMSALLQDLKDGSAPERLVDWLRGKVKKKRHE